MENENRGNGKGIASFILGIVGMVAWLLPIIGAPVTIVGLIMGIISRKQKKSGLATAGIVLCIIGLVAVIINASIGAYQGATGTLFSSTAGNVIFCEDVDANLNAVNTGTTFSAGEIYSKITLSSAFNTDKIRVTVFTVDGSSESVFDTVDQQVNQDWTVMAAPINFTTAGKYKVVFTKVSDSSKLGEGTVEIK